MEGEVVELNLNLPPRQNCYLSGVLDFVVLVVTCLSDEVDFYVLVRV